MTGNGYRRREVLGYAALASGIGLGIGSDAAAARRLQRSIAPGDWPMFGYDASGTFHNPSIEPPSENFEEAWSIEFGNPPGIVVGDGTVYAIADEVVALTTDGERQWMGSLDGERPRVGSLGERGLYVGTDASMTALDSGGEPRWRLDISDVADLDTVAYPFPLGDDLLIAQPSFAGGSGAERPLTLLDARTGDERWQRTVTHPSYPAIDDASVYVPNEEGIGAIDRTSGEFRWQTEFGVLPIALPSVTNGMLYCPGEDGLYALDADSGEILWLTERWESPTAVVDDEVVYGIRDGRLSAIDAADGSIRWEDSTESAFPQGVVGDTLYLDHPSGLVTHDTADGSVLGGFDYGSDSAALAFDDDHVYVGASSGTLFALEEGDSGSSSGGDGATEVVHVGPHGDVIFDPSSIAIDPGDTVRFVWGSNNHNVNPTSVPDGSDWQGHQQIENEGFEYEHTFAVEGRYEFVCEPHLGQGMVGEIVVGDPPFGGEDGDDGDDETARLEEWMGGAQNYEGVVDRTGESTVDVAVGAGDDGFAFDPAAVRVDPGTTIVWEWTGEGGGHNVVEVDGAFESDLFDEAGATFEYAVEDDELLLYSCLPHEAMGMKGAIVVGDAAPDAPIADASSADGGADHGSDGDDSTDEGGSDGGDSTDEEGESDGTDGDEESRDDQEEDGNESDETGGDESDRSDDNESEQSDDNESEQSDGNDGDDDPFGGDSGESGEDDVPGLGVVSAIAGLGAVAARFAGKSTDE